MTRLNPAQPRVAFAVLFLGVAALLFAAGSAHADTPPRAITVQGKAERRVAPDMATLQLQVQTEGLEAASARREADALTLQALEILRGAGVAEEDVDSTGLSINPQYRWLKDEQRQQLTGYRVSRTVTARVMDLEQLGPLLVALSDGGVNRVQPPRLGVADDEAVQRELMAAAALNARERAQAIASALGEDLGEVLSVTVGGGPGPAPMPVARMAMADSVESASPGESYSAGLITFRVQVSAAFALD